MAGIGDILKTLLYGFTVWKKVGEPVYSTYKGTQNIQNHIKSHEKQLRDMGIDVSSLQDEAYFESLSQEQKEKVCRYYEMERHLQYELGEIQDKFQSHFSQPGEMQAAEYQLKSCGIDIDAIEDRAYLDSLTLKQREMVNAFQRMRLCYLNADQQKDFNDAAVRLNRAHKEISEEMT